MGTVEESETSLVRVLSRVEPLIDQLHNEGFSSAETLLILEVALRTGKKANPHEGRAVEIMADVMQATREQMGRRE